MLLDGVGPRCRQRGDACELSPRRGAGNIQRLVHRRLGRKRAQGANLALLDHGIPVARNSLHEIDPRDATAVKALLRRCRPDAVMCCNDATAADLLVTLRTLGVRVPEDIAVTGVDGLRYASIVTPTLTTVRQPCEAIARTALKLLLERISNPSLPPREILLDAELVVGHSTFTKV